MATIDQSVLDAAAARFDQSPKLAGLPNDKTALIDLDGTVADYDCAMKRMQLALQAPNEPPYGDRYTHATEPDYITIRRKLIQGQIGFWKNLPPILMGLDVLDEIRAVGFNLHVLTKGPLKTLNAWSEKVEWCAMHMADTPVTIGSDKSLVYGRVLFDDFPPYFLKWLLVRPRGLVICLPHPWNEGFKPGGDQAHPNVFRYDGSNIEELRVLLKRAYERESREALFP